MQKLGDSRAKRPLKTLRRYHLFGSLCSVLDILESTSAPGWVQISAACFEAMQHELGANWNVPRQRRRASHGLAATSSFHCGVSLQERATETLNCRIVARGEDPLKSSKASKFSSLENQRQGEVHSLSEVGGMTYFLLPSRRHHTH